MRGVRGEPIEHRWGDWRYCTRCGIALQRHVEKPRPCTDADNVTAISELLAQRSADELFAKVTPFWR